MDAITDRRQQPTTLSMIQLALKQGLKSYANHMQIICQCLRLPLPPVSSCVNPTTGGIQLIRPTHAAGTFPQASLPPFPFPPPPSHHLTIYPGKFHANELEMTGADRHLSTPIDTNFPFSYQLDSLSFHINQANHMQIICKSYANDQRCHIGQDHGIHLPVRRASISNPYQSAMKTVR